jgi:ubiquinone/menaquinone biosynthesis C-methylase UbiE
MFKADICNLPFADNDFDILFCKPRFRTYLNDTKAMQEFKRVLKPAEWQFFKYQDLNREKLFLDAITDQKNAQHFGQYDHVCIYTAVIILVNLEVSDLK